MDKVKFILGLLILAGLLFAAGCKDDEEATVVAVSTTAVSSVTATTATSGGTVAVTGEIDVTVRGVCWSTVDPPTSADSKTSDGTGTGSFTSNITKLTANTPYYVRAYAINAGKTYYGASVSFTTAPPEPVELIINSDFSSPGVNGELVTAVPWKTDDTTDLDANGQLDYISYVFDDYKGHTGYIRTWDWSLGFYQTVGTVPSVETTFDISFNSTCTWNAWDDYKPTTVVNFSAYSGTDPAKRVTIGSVAFVEPDFWPGQGQNTWLAKSNTFILPDSIAEAFAGQYLVIEMDVMPDWMETPVPYPNPYTDVWYNIDDVSIRQH